VSGTLEPPFGSRDPDGMAARIGAAPDQIEAALADGAPWRLDGLSPDLLAVGGFGGSAIAADLAAAAWSDRLPRPLLVVRDLDWPACVTRRSLALLSSYSGTTQETLTLFERAGTRGIPRAAITTGGTLKELCRETIPCMPLPEEGPPRAALYASWVALSRLLHALDWIDDPTGAWHEAAERLRALNAECGTAVPEAANPAKQAARALHGRMPFVYAGPRMAPVATRIRNQLNENAKLLGHSAVMPELGHNEVVGWERSSETSRRAGVVILRDRKDPKGVERRLTLVDEFATAAGAHVLDRVSCDGLEPARMASLVHWGDWVSLYLALLEGVDPTPIVSIDAFKERMKEMERADAR
jgi:glucose/mannose-6-phosphate isomerase